MNPAITEKSPEPVEDPVFEDDQPSDALASASVEPLAPRTATSWILFNVAVPLGLLAAGILAFVLFGKNAPEARPDPDTTRNGILKSLPAVRVAKVGKLDLNKQKLQLRVDGLVVPFREAQIAAEVGGRIVFKSDKCEAGSIVKKDELLMRIDPTNYKLEVERLQKQREQAYESLQELNQEEKNTQRLLDVATQDVALQQAEVDRQLALPKGFSSPKDIDQAKRAKLQAEQQKVGYENQLQLIGSRRNRLDAAEKLAKTQLDIAQEDLNRTQIKAPMSGVIVSEQAELNSFVNRGSPLVMIEETDKVEVVANLRMDQLYWLLDQRSDGVAVSDASGYTLPETPATVEFDLVSRPGTVYRWKGEVIGYNGIGLDSATRTVPIRIVVDDPRHYLDANGNVHETQGPTPLVRGMYVRVYLDIKPKTPLVLIPAKAIKPGNRVWHFVEDESVLEPPKKSQSGDSGDSASSDQKKPVPAKAENSEELDEGFDPKDWNAGKVKEVDEIIPVDALTIQQIGSEMTSSNEPPDSEERIWVCEVKDRSIGEGAFVVTSPMAAVLPEGVPARAKLSEADTQEDSLGEKATANKTAGKSETE